MDGRLEGYDTPHRAFAAWPTNDDLTLDCGELADCRIRSEQGGRRGKLPEDDRHLAALVGTRSRRPAAKSDSSAWSCPGFFRKPFGPGWALVGDAGYNKDFITAQGIADAFRSAELCTDAIDDAFAGRSTFDAAMTRYQTSRDEQAMPTYEFTNQFAALAPPPPEMQQLMAAVHGNQEAMNGFVRVFAGIDVTGSVLLRGERGKDLCGGAGADCVTLNWICLALLTDRPRSSAARP